MRCELWALAPRVHLHNSFGAAPRSQPLLPVLPVGGPPLDRAREDRCGLPSERCRGGRVTHVGFRRFCAGFASILDEQTGGPWTITGFERHGCFVVMARFRLGSTPESVEYKAVLYDPSTDAWSEAPFPAAPVQAYRCTHIDGILFAWGSQGPEERGVGTEGGLWGRENSRIVMLRPGSTTWVDVPMPPDLRCLATRLAAVRIG